MAKSKLMLRTALVDDQFMNNCSNLTAYCTDPGVYPIFLRLMSEIYGFSIHITVVGSYGGEDPYENDTLFSALRDGLIDFAGPDYLFTVGRDMMADASMSITRQRLSMFSKRQVSTIELGFYQFLGQTVYFLGVGALLATILVVNIRNKMTVTGLNYFSFISKIPTTLFFITIGALLNLYASQITVKAVKHLEKTIHFKSLEELRDAIDTNRYILLQLPISTGSTQYVMGLLAMGENTTRRNSTMQKIQLLNDDKEILEKLLEIPNSLALLVPRWTAAVPEWLAYCESIAVTHTNKILPSSMQGGFYYSRNPPNMNSLEVLKRTVTNDTEMVVRLLGLSERQFRKRFQKRLKCQNQEASDKGKTTSTSLSGIWHMSFNTILIHGLTIATLLFVMEWLYANCSFGNN